MAKMSDYDDLIIPPAKRSPQADEETRRVFAAERQRPDAGKQAAEVLKMIEARIKKNKKQSANRE